MSNRSADAAGFIYFVQMMGGDHQIKIGFTTDIARRLMELRIACPYKIDLLAMCPGTRADEAAHHDRFSAEHIRGEWFESSVELLRHAVNIRNEQAKARKLAGEEPIKYRLINARFPV